jgi:hypothetical protein
LVNKSANQKSRKYFSAFSPPPPTGEHIGRAKKRFPDFRNAAGTVTKNTSKEHKKGLQKLNA